MSTFNEFIDIKYGDDFQIIQQGVGNGHINELFDQYKEIIITNLIQQFGLGPILDLYKRGGNVTTLHNAKEGVFANGADEQRYQQNYTQKLRKDLYEKDFQKNRKKIFQENESIIDDYTGKVLHKDGRTHRDHVISASEIQNNDAARLYMSNEARGAMAVDERNLAWTDSSLNQSKGEHDLIEWMNKDNRKDSSINNAEYYEIEEERANSKYKQARKHIDSSVKRAEVSYYIKNVTSTGITQGVTMGKKQAIGLFIYELQESLLVEMKIYFKRYKNYPSWKDKLSGFEQACQNVKQHMISKAKKIFVSFTDGFISGFIGNIITVLINTFANTAKNVVRVLNEGIHSLIKATKLFIRPPAGLTKKEALFEATKIISASVTTTFGVILTEAFVNYLLTTPFASFAHIIGGLIGGILTGILSATVVYAIDYYADIIANVKTAMINLTYDLRVSSIQIREKYQAAIAAIDSQYADIMNQIYKEYEQLNRMTRKAYDLSQGSEKLAESSLALARTLKVEEEKIMENSNDVLSFFLR